jgi:small GTP-binding protein
MKALRVKVALIGNSGTGKTALITRWNLGVFRETGNMVTVGAAFVSKEVDVAGYGQTSAHIWDTAGQEVFHSLVPGYLRGSHAVVIVTAITDKDSFGAIERWMACVTASCPVTPPLILAVNKMDLAEGAAMEPGDVQVRFTGQFVTILCTSAATSENVGALFDCAILEGRKFAAKVENPKEPEPKGEESKGKCCSG